MAALLRIQQLGVEFGSSMAVRGLSLKLEAGESVGLVGESGSGKSVTSLAVMGLLPATARLSGQILWQPEGAAEAVDLLQVAEKKRRSLRGKEIAMIFQEPMTALNPVMSIGRQVAEAAEAHGATGREARRRALEALEAVAIPEFASRYNDFPHQFSGGQRQRILIAMALINKPRLLIADEPTTALDVTVQAQILSLLAELKERHGLTMLFISHDLAVVGQVADRIAVMRHGEKLEEAPARELLLRPQHEYTKSLLAAVPTLKSDRERPLAQIAG